VVYLVIVKHGADNRHQHHYDDKVGLEVLTGSHTALD